MARLDSLIPDGVFAQHIAVLGKTRSGKSSVLRLFVEHLLGRERPVCIIDPKGDWYGLRSSADGKRSGYPVVIFGGEHADVAIDVRSGTPVAELVATGNRPCIIDLGGWMVGERTRFFVDFASALFRKTKGSRWLVIDEVHNFAPQGKVLDPDAGKMLHWANRLASEGLGKGLAILSASQRPQKVHKDFLTCAETLIAMRVIHPLDRNAVKEWIDGCPNAEKGKEVLGGLASMQRGEGWVWSPEIGFGPTRVAFPMFGTYDSFRPRTADAGLKLKGWAEVDLDEVRTRLAATIEQSRQNDPAALRQRIAALEREMAARAPAPQPRTQVVEKPILRDGQLNRVEKLAASFNGRLEALTVELTELRKTISPALRTGPPPTAPGPREALGPKPPPRRPNPESNGNARSLGKGERTILTAIAQHPGGVSREQLTVLTGYRRSSRDTYLQRLLGPGYAGCDGGRIFATDLGVQTLGDDYAPLPVGDALRGYWMERLGGGEKAILEVVCAAYPQAVERERISEETRYQRSSRDTYLQRLAARQLVICERGTVRAQEALFGAG